MSIFRRGREAGTPALPSIEEIEAMAIDAPDPRVEDEVRAYNLYRKLGGEALPEYAEKLLQRAEDSHPATGALETSISV